MRNEHWTILIASFFVKCCFRLFVAISPLFDTLLLIDANALDQCPEVSKTTDDFSVALI